MDSTGPTQPSQPPPDDLDAITSAARDYIEGWYSADPARMERCLHTDLVKRSIFRERPTGGLHLRRPSDAAMMVQFTREGGGSHTPRAAQTYEIKILDMFRHIATAKVISHEMMDYLHLAKIDNTWLIVNVLWELKEGELTPGE